MEGKYVDASVVYGSRILDLDKIKKDNYYKKNVGNLYQGWDRNFYVYMRAREALLSALPKIDYNQVKTLDISHKICKLVLKVMNILKN